MLNDHTTPEEDRERTADEEVIDRIRRYRFRIKEYKLQLILGLLMALSMLAVAVFKIFYVLRDLLLAPSDPIISQLLVLTAVGLGWILGGVFVGMWGFVGSVLMDSPVQRLLLKYYDLSIELEDRLELQQRTTDKHTT